jgi:hypothetical protein
VYTHQQFVGKSVKQLRAEKEAIVDQLAKIKMKGSTTAEQLSPTAVQQASTVISQGISVSQEIRAKLAGVEEKIHAANASAVLRGDDHHSPVKPDAYISARIHHMMHFYQERLPVYSRARWALRTVILCCSAGSAILSYLDLASYVVMVTSLAGAIISWTEFSEIGKKIERYSRAVRSLKKLLAWWDVLTDVERAGTDNISSLIETAESIIADERQAWQATSNRLSMSKRSNDTSSSQESSNYSDPTEKKDKRLPDKP